VSVMKGRHSIFYLLYKDLEYIVEFRDDDVEQENDSTQLGGQYPVAWIE
jgi:hypothetical protein